MKNDTLTVLGATVDRLAQIKAQIADLKAEEAGLKLELIASGESVIEGMYHRAAITDRPGAISVDWQAVANHFKPSRQLITAHTSQGEAHSVVRVSARKTS